MKGQDEGLVSTITIAEVLTGFYIAGDTAKAAKAKKLLKDLTGSMFQRAISFVRKSARELRLVCRSKL